MACVLGKIVFSFSGVMYGPLHYRHTEHDKIRALRNNQWNFDKRMSLSRRARSELEWWVDNVTTAKNVMTRDALMHTLTIPQMPLTMAGEPCMATSQQVSGPPTKRVIT